VAAPARTEAAAEGAAVAAVVTTESTHGAAAEAEEAQADWLPKAGVRAAWLVEDPSVSTSSTPPRQFPATTFNVVTAVTAVTGVTAVAANRVAWEDFPGHTPEPRAREPEGLGPTVVMAEGEVVAAAARVGESFQ
jgi:hypothetical protein